jgi:hypothetical protein
MLSRSCLRASGLHLTPRPRPSLSHQSGCPPISTIGMEPIFFSPTLVTVEKSPLHSLNRVGGPSFAYVFPEDVEAAQRLFEQRFEAIRTPFTSNCAERMARLFGSMSKEFRCITGGAFRGIVGTSALQNEHCFAMRTVWYQTSSMSSFSASAVHRCGESLLCCSTNSCWTG